MTIKQRSEAERLYRQVLAGDPDHFDSLVGLASIGSRDEAQSLLRRAIAQKPDDPGRLFKLAEGLRGQGLPDEALDCYRQILHHRPGDAEATKALLSTLSELYAMALGEHQARRLGNAERIYRRILAICPSHPETLNNLGQILQADEAIPLFLQALALRPGFVDARINLGNALRSAGRDAEALACYREAVRIKSESPLAWYNLGLLFDSLRRFDEAAACYRRTIEVQPDFAMAYDKLGDAVNFRGRAGEAAFFWERCLRIDHTIVEAMINIGIVYRSRSLFEQATGYFERALSIHPGHFGSCA